MRACVRCTWCCAVDMLSYKVMSTSRSESNNHTRSDDSYLAACMARYQEGDAAAFENLYDRISAELRLYLLYLCGDPELAEDCMQDCFLQIHKVRQTYRPPRPFRPWAFAIARHVYFMMRRSRSRRAYHEHRFPAIDWYRPESPARLACQEDIHKALARLPLEAREALVLHHAFGMSFADIGTMTGIRKGTAKTRSHRALMQIREILGVSNG